MLIKYKESNSWYINILDFLIIILCILVFILCIILEIDYVTR